MALSFRIGLDWEADGTGLDLGGLAEMLQLVAQTGTVRAAAEQLGASYRTVWGKLDAAETSLGQKLVVKSKGHGSLLTPTGEELVRLVANLNQAVQQGASPHRQACEEQFFRLFSKAAPKLRLVGSHDIVIRDCIQAGLLADWDISIMESLEAIEALKGGTADLAGFSLRDDSIQSYSAGELWANAAYSVVPVMRREQGFIVARDNPLGIKDVEDLVRPEVRFINRQKGASTRLWFDELIRARGIHSEKIGGYTWEEFTHSAVAMAVAAGAADVAFALRAATAGLPLDFIPVGFETYFIAGRSEIVDGPRFRGLLDNITARIPAHPGYLMPPATIGRASA